LCSCGLGQEVQWAFCRWFLVSHHHLLQNDRLKYEESGNRKEILKLIVLLYNYRSTQVGINQLLNTYMPHFSIEAQTVFDD
jgi:hypothetical protein